MPLIELDDDTVRQIAAGEVVERPASVVKELVENSLDADAGRVEVEVEAGGKRRIAVADDGAGMTREEARLAVEEHTTSKLGSAADLVAGVGTLGFRGEALYAIGAVSTMTLTTRPREGGEPSEARRASSGKRSESDGGERTDGSRASSDRRSDGDTATAVTVERGEIVDVAPAGRAPGTTVEVTDLFAGTPAREKFLSTDATEFDHVSRIVARYALANPEVAVSLSHDGREVFATTGRGDLDGALLSVYGRAVAEAMRPVDGDGVGGRVSHPETTRSTREYVSTYVNGRYVPSGTLRGAVVDAYGSQLAPDRYPFAAVFVEVPPGAVDVNVHPRKLEVRFDDPAGVSERVRSAVEDALLEGGLVRAGAPRGASRPAEVELQPGDGDAPGASTDADAGRTDAPAAPSDDDAGSADSPAASAAAGAGSADSPTRPAGGADAASAGSDDGSPARADASRPAPDSTASAAGGGEPPSWHGRRIRERGTQTTLDADLVDEPVDLDRLPALRVLGQLDGTYVVCEADGGLVLVDQHAADERVHYERLAARLADDPSAQALAEPVRLELTAREAELFQAVAGALSAVGFRAEAVEDRAVEVSAVPAALEGALDAGLLRDVLPELVHAGEAASVDARADALLADLACHPAITGGTSLAAGSIRSLLEALDACENPYACPHGRPTMVEVSADELADRFERDYPGHAGRRGEP